MSGILEAINAQASSIETFIQKWKEAHVEKSRIMFLFIKSEGSYTFNSLATTDLISYGQLPEIVRDYIEQKIIKLESTYQDAIKVGLNAIINAYDQRFKNTLTNTGTSMLSLSKYFKGNCYVESLIYFDEFEPYHIDNALHYRYQYREADNTNWDEELRVSRLSDGISPSQFMAQSFYYNGPFEQMRASDYFKNRAALLFAYTDKGIFGPGAKYIRLNKINSSNSADPIPMDQLFYYKSNGEKKMLNSPSVNSEYVEIYDTDSRRVIARMRQDRNYSLSIRINYSSPNLEQPKPEKG